MTSSWLTGNYCLASTEHERQRQHVEVMRLLTAQADIISDHVASAVDTEYLALPASRLPPPDVALTQHSKATATTQHHTTALFAVSSTSTVNKTRRAKTSPEQLTVGNQRRTGDLVKPTSSLIYQLNMSHDLLTKCPGTASGLSEIRRDVEPRDKRASSEYNSEHFTDWVVKTKRTAALRDAKKNNQHSSDPYTDVNLVWNDQRRQRQEEQSSLQ